MATFLGAIENRATGPLFTYPNAGPGYQDSCWGHGGGSGTLPIEGVREALTKSRKFLDMSWKNIRQAENAIKNVWERNLRNVLAADYYKPDERKRKIEEAQRNLESGRRHLVRSQEEYELNLQKNLRLRTVYAMMERDLKRMPNRDRALKIPVCFSEKPWVTAHEKMHGEIAKVFPHYKRNDPRYIKRNKVVDRAVFAHLMALGPSAQDLLRIYWKAHIWDAGEEFLSGIAGLGAILARAGAKDMTSSKLADMLDDAVEAFASYIDFSKVPNAGSHYLQVFGQAAVNAGGDFNRTYGGNLTRAGLDFRKFAL